MDPRPKCRANCKISTVKKVKAKIIKLLGGNFVTLLQAKPPKISYHTKVQATKEKINKLDFINIKNFCAENPKWGEDACELYI